MSATAVPSNAATHAGRVRELSTKRTIYRKCSQVASQALNGSTVEDLTASLASDAEELQRRFKPASRVDLVLLSNVKPERVTWLWPDRIPAGKLTTLAGDPGLGKSFLTLAVASIVSTGGQWPDIGERGVDGPGGVVLLGAEDGIADTVVPRLIAAGADLKRIASIVAARPRGHNGEAAFNLQRDLESLRDAIAQTPDCRLVVVDPISAYLGNADSHKDADVRRVLAPLSRLAEETGVAVVCVAHLNKAAGAAAINRVSGSMAFIAAAWMGWGVARDPSEPARRILCPIKCNLAREPQRLGYRVLSGPDGVGVVTFEAEPCAADPKELFAPPERRKPGPRPERQDEAADWLRAFLADGAVESTEVEQLAKQAGHSVGTVRRAKEAIGIESRKVGKTWTWSLPTESEFEQVEHLDPVPE